ncbi:hypothetical protein WJX72_010676 [[Myrmecia] bisecta]|uniref:CHRD domain-containing protein n=1 Tax=[Myrmecia] bisecta TaxID=41462 RepID=A0AAW1R8Y2_9CHLO
MAIASFWSPRLLPVSLLIFAAAVNGQGWTVLLTGANQVPFVDTAATGTGSFRFTDDTKQFMALLVTVQDLPSPRLMHVHLGSAGQDGEVITESFYTNTNPPASNFNGVLANGTFGANVLVGQLQGKPLTDLAALFDSQSTYLNIHTTDHPNGLIRGQVKPASIGGAIAVLAPAPAPSAAQLAAACYASARQDLNATLAQALQDAQAQFDESITAAQLAYTASLDLANTTCRNPGTVTATPPVARTPPRSSNAPAPSQATPPVAAAPTRSSGVLDFGFSPAAAPSVVGMNVSSFTSQTMSSNCTSLADVVAMAPGLTALKAALEAANLTSVLAARDLRWTLFAPTDQAFQVYFSSLNMTARDVLSNSTLLRAVLLNHVWAGGAPRAANLTDGQVLPTQLAGSSLVVSRASPARAPPTRKLLQGSDIYILSGGTLVRNGAANVLLADIPACKSIVHVVDALLLPAAQVLAAYVQGT